jgi:TatD DNase family protein
VFRFQIELALEVGRPIIIHARESEPRVCDILSEYAGLADRVVFHCFSGGAGLARRALDLGFWLSFTGVVTFRNADSIREAARLAPRERIMVETDAPYLSPEPVRKMRPCEPAFVAHTARFLAELRSEDFGDFAAATTANAERFFGLAPEARGRGDA